MSITIESTISGSGSPNYLDYVGNVVVSGNYLYAVSRVDDAFVVIDISDKSNPVTVATIVGAGFPNYLGKASDLVKDEDYVYIVSGIDDAIVVIDVSIPTSPSKVGHYFYALNSPYAINKSGNYVFVADQGSLRVYDYSNISTPSYVTAISISIDFTVTRIEIDGDYAYCCCNDTVVSVDISDPTTLTKLDEIVFGGAVSGITINGNYLYVTVDSINSFYIYDISDPSNITYVNHISGSGSPYYLDYPRDVKIKGNYAFVFTMYDNFSLSGSVVVFDISNPTNILLEGALLAQTLLAGIRRAVIDGNYAYAVCTYQDKNKITIIDITDPTVPTIISTYLGYVNNVVVSGNYLYAVSRVDDAFVVIDISDKSNPVTVATIVGAGFPNYLGKASDLVKDEDYVYIVSGIDDAIVVIDVSIPTSPVLINPTFTNGTQRAINKCGVYMFVGEDTYFNVYLIEEPPPYYYADASILGEEEASYEGDLYTVFEEKYSSDTQIMKQNIDNFYNSDISIKDTIDMEYSSDIVIPFDIKHFSDIYFIKQDIPVIYNSDIAIQGTFELDYSVDIIIERIKIYYADIQILKNDINRIYYSDIFIEGPEDRRYYSSATLRALNTSISYGADISLAIDQRYSADIAMKKEQTNSLTAKLTVGNSAKYFIIQDGRESHPSDVYWIKILEDKESESSGVNTLNIEYKNNLPCSIYINNPKPSGGFIIN